MNLRLIVSLFLSFLFFGCGKNHQTLDKNAPVHKEMSFSEFYGVQTSPKHMAELEGKIIEMKGFFSSESPSEVKNQNADLGKYKMNIGPGIGGTGFSVECYFNEMIKINNWKECRVKGEVTERGMLKLINCVVCE